ncbi:Cyclin-dependent kinase 10, partial [Stegodyphus mimosarum]
MSQAIPGLLHVPVEESGNSSGEGIKLISFDLRPFVVPEAHRCGKCRPVSDFDKLTHIGEGAYGTVYKARDKKSNEIVALKKLKIGKEYECMPLNFTREITILKTLRHDNIIDLRAVAVGRSFESTFLVLEYCAYGLARVIDEVGKPLLQQPQIKCIMQQLFSGVDYLHKRFVLHRDLNVSNILFTHSGCLKITDFGLSRHILPGSMTPNVVSRWYRAPEILFGSITYTSAIDMWSTGCIFAELLLKKPLFRADSDCDMIRLIIESLGTPTESIWPGLSKLPLLQNYDLWWQPSNKLSKTFED